MSEVLLLAMPCLICTSIREFVRIDLLNKLSWGTQENVMEIAILLFKKILDAWGVGSDLTKTFSISHFQSSSHYKFFFIQILLTHLQCYHGDFSVKWVVSKQSCKTNWPCLWPICHSLRRRREWSTDWRLLVHNTGNFQYGFQNVKIQSRTVRFIWPKTAPWAYLHRIFEKKWQSS